VESDLKEQLEAMYRDRITQLEEKNIERDQFEAELKEKLAVKDREKEEMEATLCRQIKEMEHVEAALRGEIEDLRSDLIQKESNKKILEISLFGQIKILQKRLQEKNAYIEVLEKTIADKFKELRNVTEAHGAKVKEIMDLSEKLKTYSDKKEGESPLHDQRKCYEGKLQERDAESEKVQNTIIGMIETLRQELEESNRDKRLLQDTVDRLMGDLRVSLVLNLHFIARIESFSPNVENK